MKNLIILLSLVLLSCGSTKNKQSSSSIIDTTSVSKVKIKNDIVDNTTIKDTTSITKKDSITKNNSIVTDESDINIEPIDSTKPIIIEDNKGIKHKITNGKVNIKKKQIKDNSKTISNFTSTINSGSSTISKNSNKSSIISTNNRKGKTVLESNTAFKRNWTLFPIFILLLAISILYLHPYIIRFWGIIKKLIFKI